ncbi:phosphoglycerate kinase [Desulfovibrio aminophilus]|nr:phosphoglycerate kinase [Desulfovibrio aminophilus]MCM0754372.1 phosphoglycerate kinase [Desulfovibrio aminophilus]
MRYIDQIDLKGRKVLVRVDFNVPLENGVITDDNRIRQSLPTLRRVLEQGGALILCAHLGKPKGVDPKLSLAPVAAHLAKLLGREVRLAPDCVGPEVEKMARELAPGQVLMLENLRFHAEETGKTPEARGDFGKRLAGLADVYVGEGFGVVHRPNASVVDAPRAAALCCAGFLMKKEWQFLGERLAAPERPFVAISGGAKVSTKLGILKNLLGKVDDLIIGGAMANTFFLAQGHGIGASLAEPDLVEEAKAVLAEAAGKGTRLHLPEDVVLGASPKDAAASGTTGVDAIPDGAMVLDIGPRSVEAFTKVIASARTVVWNGPMGLFENPAFAAGSLGICRAMAANAGAVTIVGGGDTDAMIHAAGLVDKFSFISTGGGSFLEFLEGKELPGLSALKECS